MKMFNFNGEEYYIDLDVIFELLENGTFDGTKKNVNISTQKELSNTYESDEEGALQLTQKNVHEIMTPKDDEENEKYNLVRYLLETLFKESESCINNNTSITTKLIFNTLLNKGIIKKYRQ